MVQISVLGCGWLGLPLAKALLKESFTISGSTTSPEKIELLTGAGINPSIINLDEDLSNQETTEFLRESEILIINVPPKSHLGDTTYAGKLEKLLPFIQIAGITKVLFVSATSVYPDDNGIATEDSTTTTDVRGRELLKAEQVFTTQPEFKTTVLRFSGLMGEERHPVKFLAGRENIANPDAPVNLIHLNDCIGIILKIIEKESWGEVYNGSAPSNPSRIDYYTKKAVEYNLPEPKFNHDVPSVGKTISAKKVTDVLGYSFVVDL
jgi:nucleoside-diphosphate-sugar epimerase